MRLERRYGLSAAQKTEIWRRWKVGESLHEIGRALDKNHGSIHFLLSQHGGIAPADCRRPDLLAPVDRDEEGEHRHRERSRCGGRYFEGNDTEQPATAAKLSATTGNGATRPRRPARSKATRFSRRPSIIFGWISERGLGSRT